MASPTTLSPASATAAPATLTPVPTSTAAPPPTSSPTRPPTATARPTATATPLAACSERQPLDNDLLVLVSREYGLSPEYEPGDLVALSDTFPNSVTLGYPTQVREVIVQPLEEIVAAMQAEELAPLIISGFRDYYAQALAREKWREQFPDWADNLSAPPGHSEHQLGTTVDFGSPELPDLVGEEFIQFHPAFAQTSEGVWLADRAHEFGFTMSYPANRFETTAFYYEPWHFRYVGKELATQLWEQDLTLYEYLLESRPAPCIP